MHHNWMAMLVIAGGINTAIFGQQYPQQNPQPYPTYQGDPNFNGQNGNGQYNSGQYAGDPGYGTYTDDPAYDGSDEGIYAPAPPPAPSYAYARPPMPGPGYYWVDGYWDFLGGRYSWIGGYWTLPPYGGGYWVSPRYTGGRYFRGFWGGGRRNFDRRFVRNYYRYQPRGGTRWQGYRAPARNESGFRGGSTRGGRENNWGQRRGRR